MGTRFLMSIDFGELDKFQSSQPKLGGPIFHRIYQNHPSTVVKASTLPKIAIHRKDDFIKQPAILTMKDLTKPVTILMHRRISISRFGEIDGAESLTLTIQKIDN